MVDLQDHGGPVPDPREALGAIQGRDLLQWDIEASKLTGPKQEWAGRVDGPQPSDPRVGDRGNSAFKHLSQYDHSRKFKQRWPQTAVILHKTGMNKHDERTGGEALLPKLYRSGLKRLPARATDCEARHILADFRKELAQYPARATWDLVMADWFGEWNIARILAQGRRSAHVDAEGAKVPP